MIQCRQLDQSKMIYNWRRYWCSSREAGIHLDLSGFLADPEGDLASVETELDTKSSGYYSRKDIT